MGGTACAALKKDLRRLTDLRVHQRACSLRQSDYSEQNSMVFYSFGILAYGKNSVCFISFLYYRLSKTKAKEDRIKT